MPIRFSLLYFALSLIVINADAQVALPVQGDPNPCEIDSSDGLMVCIYTPKYSQGLATYNKWITQIMLQVFKDTISKANGYFIPIVSSGVEDTIQYGGFDVRTDAKGNKVYYEDQITRRLRALDKPFSVSAAADKNNINLEVGVYSITRNSSQNTNFGLGIKPASAANVHTNTVTTGNSTSDFAGVLFQLGKTVANSGLLFRIRLDLANETGYTVLKKTGATTVRNGSPFVVSYDQGQVFEKSTGYSNRASGQVGINATGSIVLDGQDPDKLSITDSYFNYSYFSEPNPSQEEKTVALTINSLCSLNGATINLTSGVPQILCSFHLENRLKTKGLSLFSYDSVNTNDETTLYFVISAKSNKILNQPNSQENPANNQDLGSSFASILSAAKIEVRAGGLLDETALFGRRVLLRLPLDRYSKQIEGKRMKVTLIRGESKRVSVSTIKNLVENGVEIKLAERAQDLCSDLGDYENCTIPLDVLMEPDPLDKDPVPQFNQKVRCHAEYSPTRAEPADSEAVLQPKRNCVLQ